MDSQAKRVLLELRGATKVFPTVDGPFVAVKGAHLEIRAGEFLGITGKSGAGKTTLLNLISGVSPATSGEVLFYPAGRPTGGAAPVRPVALHRLDQDRLSRWRGENVGVVYQSFELIPTLSLLENVMLPPDFAGTYRPTISRQRALELLTMVEIEQHAHKVPAHISGGQRQRVAIARALVNDPGLILADEPTGNLDSATAETIFVLFEELVRRGKTIVMVTHDDGMAARFERRLVITDGVLSQPVAQTAQAVTDLSEALRHQANQLAVDLTDSRCAEVAVPTTAPLDAPKREPAIRLTAVKKVYANAAGKFTALKHVDLEFGYGEFISIVGKSGCGKSTLLNMITGIDHPTQGDVVIRDQHIYKLNNSQLARWRGRNMGVVFQFFQLLPTLTLLENTMLPMDFCNLYSNKQRSERATELLCQVGLEKQIHQLPTAVSSGQQQCAAIARALANDPAIVLADEPTGNLDSRSADNVLRIFDELARQGKTIIIVTHDPSLARRTHRTVVMSDGEVIDPAIVQALPGLSHKEMLAATHQVERHRYPPHAHILNRGDSVDHLYVVSAGEVAITRPTAGGGDQQLACLRTGQFFGEIELTGGGAAIANVVASPEGAEVLALPRASFERFLQSSPLTGQIFEVVAGSRIAEHHGPDKEMV